MRIAWTITGFSKDENDYGGAAAIHNLAKALSLSGEIDLTIFSLYYPFNQPEYKFYNAKVFSSAGKNVHNKIDKPGIWRRCINKFSKEHQKNKFDIIHSMWAGESGYIAVRLSKEFKIPMIVNICGGELAELKDINYGSRLKFWQKKFVDRSLKSANKIVAGSDYIIDKINSYYGDNILNKTIKIPFGVDEKVFYPHLNFDITRKFKLINLANAVPVKDHKTLFEAIKIVSKIIPEIKLRVFGKDETSILKKQSCKIGVEKFVELNNFINFTQVPSVLNGSGIYIASSLYESQNMSLVEAAFCGLPVISTDTGSAKEITDHIIEPGNYNNLAEEIIKVINNYEEERKKAILKTDKLTKMYTLSFISNRYFSLYRQLKINS